jgi:hypothetical protein
MPSRSRPLSGQSFRRRRPEHRIARSPQVDSASAHARGRPGVVTHRTRSRILEVGVLFIARPGDPHSGLPVSAPVPRECPGAEGVQESPSPPPPGVASMAPFELPSTATRTRVVSPDVGRLVDVRQTWRVVHLIQVVAGVGRSTQQRALAQLPPASSSLKAHAPR